MNEATTAAPAAERFPVAVRAFTMPTGKTRSRRKPRLNTVLTGLLDPETGCEADLRRLYAWLKTGTTREELLAYLTGQPGRLAELAEWAARYPKQHNPVRALRRQLNNAFSLHRHVRATHNWGSLVLIFDCETSLDPAQRLLYGCWRLCRWSPDGQLECVEEGLFYEDDLAEHDPEGFAALHAYVTDHQADVGLPWRRENGRLTLCSARQFVKNRLLKYGWDRARKALITGYNLPFDLSRLALNAGEARGNAYGGFSFLLLDYLDEKSGLRKESPYAPRLRIVQRNAFSSHCSFAGGEDGRGEEARKDRFKSGRFVDCRSLVYELTNKSHSLKSTTDKNGPFPTRHKKTDVELGGVTPEAITYCRNDVLVTAELLERLRAEYEGRHPSCDLLPDYAASPARVGKKYKEAMRLQPFLKQHAEWTRTIEGQEVLAASMAAFFGGRLETDITNVPLPVVYVDGLSAYCTSAVRLGVWKLETARRIDVQDAIEWARAHVGRLLVETEAGLDGANLGELLSPESVVLVEVEPDGDILPVRAKLDGKAYAGCLAPFTSETPAWYWLPDVDAAVILGRKAPHIRRALRLVPVGRQPGLRTVNLLGRREFDPKAEDFYKVLVELRAEIKTEPCVAGECLPEPEREWLPGLVKAMGQAAAYGVGVQFNRTNHPPEERVELAIAGRNKPYMTNHPETPGPWFAPWSSCVPAGCRLQVALFERMVKDAGGAFVFASVDAAAVVSTEHGGLIPCPGGRERIAPAGKRKPVEAIRALSWAEIDGIRQRLSDAFNPYDRALIPTIWRLEDENYAPCGLPGHKKTCVCGRRRRQLWAYSIRGAEYALFNRDEQTGELASLRRTEINVRDTEGDEAEGGAEDEDEGDADDTGVRKGSEHGLAAVLGKDRIREWWAWKLRKELGQEPPELSWLDELAVSQLTINSYELLRPFEKQNEGKRYQDQVKPFSFMLGLTCQPQGRLSGKGRFYLVGQFERDDQKRREQPWFNRWTGKQHQISIGMPGDTAMIARAEMAGQDDTAYVKSLGYVLAEFEHGHERKMLTPAGLVPEPDCGRFYRGVLVPRPVVAAGPPEIVGKETNWTARQDSHLAETTDLNLYNKDELDRHLWETLVVPVLRDIHPRAPMAAAANLNLSKLRAVLNDGAYPHPNTRAALRGYAVRFATGLLRQWGAEPASLISMNVALRAYLDHPRRNARSCATAGCQRTPRGRQQHCDACKMKISRERKRTAGEDAA